MINKLKNKIKFLLKSKSEKVKINQDRIQFIRCKPWFEARGDETLRLDYNLSENSVVFDLGGYKGEFATSIYNKYKSQIYIFEPVKSFFEIIEEKFSNNPKIEPFFYGLAGENKTMQISHTDDASSVFIDSKDSETIQLKSIVGFIKEHKIDHIDLIKINIEGGEYEVLEALLEHGLITKFTDLQIQFHDFIMPNAKGRMTAIQEQLSKTHQLTYQYEFVWENWTLKKQ